MIPVETPGTQLSIHEVLGGPQRDLEDLLAIHADLFPQYAYYHAYMRHRAKQPSDADPRTVEHWWLIRLNGQAAAVRFFKYVPGRNCGIALAIGIKPDYRRHTFGRYRRFSEAILHTSLQQVQSDAEVAGKPTPVGMVVEIEHYLFARYFDEYGHLRLPIDYLEPSFTAEAKPFLDSTAQLEFRPIALGILPTDSCPFNPLDEKMLNDVVFALLIDHYGLPENHWTVRRALDSIQMAQRAEEK
jgi:hypothetical protein